LSFGSATFTYNNRGRMTTATNAGTAATYTYNALGQRVRRTTAGATTLHVFDKWRLAGEYTSAGMLIQETVWLGATPVATLRLNGSGGVALFYVHADHLNAPRLITDSSNNIRWRWDSDAFGTTMPNENPASLGVFVYNLRFPGQQFDPLTGLNYNYFRDYDPAVGGYIQSDPIGLGAGSFSTYAYVGGDPLGAYDPLGLQAAEAWPNSPTPASPPRGPGRVIPFPRPPPSPGAGAAEGLGFLGRCAGVVALAFTPNPNAGGECSAKYPPPDSNCPQNDDRCREALARLFRVYFELTRRAIPQYMYAGTQGTANSGHHGGILQLLVELNSAIRQVEAYCKPDQLPLNFERMKQIAGQMFPVRH